jgi:hypothetical protein
MKYYIIYKPNKKENFFLDCDHENEMIQAIKERKDAILSNYEIYLKII